jgi:hypothetical protein
MRRATSCSEVHWTPRTGVLRRTTLLREARTLLFVRHVRRALALRLAGPRREAWMDGGGAGGVMSAVAVI